MVRGLGVGVDAAETVSDDEAPGVVEHPATLHDTTSAMIASRFANRLPDESTATQNHQGRIGVEPAVLRHGVPN